MDCEKHKIKCHRRVRDICGEGLCLFGQKTIPVSKRALCVSAQGIIRNYATLKKVRTRGSKLYLIL